MSIKEYGSEPAFAVPGTVDSYQQVGLTKREYFAAMALQGVIVNTRMQPNGTAAAMAVAFADELLEELGR